MGDAKRRREQGLDGPHGKLVAELHDALMDAEHLRRLLALPEFERERILADLPGIIDSFAPQCDGVEYDRARTWHRMVKRAVLERLGDL